MTITSGSVPKALPGGKSSLSGARVFNEGNDNNHAFQKSGSCAFQDPQNCLAHRPTRYLGYTES